MHLGVDSRRAEYELLLRCAGAQFGLDASGASRTHSGSLDWTYLLNAAYVHGVAPLAHRHLTGLHPGIPGEVQRKLRAHYLTNAAHAQLLVEQLREILGRFNASDIQAVPFKGPVLAARAYGSVSLRHYTDLDLLIHERDLAAAERVLLDIGYGLRTDVVEETEHPGEGERKLCKGRSLVELHWEIAPKHFRLPLTQSVWGRLGSTLVDGVAVPCLAPEDTLLLLSVHGYKHHWSRLCHMFDVAGIVCTQHGMDWSAVVRRAGEVHCARMLFVALQLAEAVVGATPPPPVLSKMRTDPVAGQMAKRIQRRLLSATEGRLETLERVLAQARMRERLSDRIAFAAWRVGVAVKPQGVHGVLPTLRRPMQLLGKYALALLAPTGRRSRPSRSA